MFWQSKFHFKWEVKTKYHFPLVDSQKKLKDDKTFVSKNSVALCIWSLKRQKSTFKFRYVMGSGLLTNKLERHKNTAAAKKKTRTTQERDYEMKKRKEKKYVAFFSTICVWIRPTRKFPCRMRSEKEGAWRSNEHTTTNNNDTIIIMIWLLFLQF